MGQVVVVQLTEPPALYGQPVGRVAEVLGEVDDPGMEVEIAVRKYAVPHVFSDACLAQAQALALVAMAAKVAVAQAQELATVAKALATAARVAAEQAQEPVLVAMVVMERARALEPAPAAKVAALGMVVVAPNVTTAGRARKPAMRS